MPVAPAAGTKITVPAASSATVTSVAAVIAVPARVIVPALGSWIKTDCRALLSPALSVKPKSDAASLRMPFLSTASEVLVPLGASLTDSTVSAALSVALEKALLPPLLAVLTVSPLAPLLRSQARKVIAFAIVPLKLAFGLKVSRVAASAASSSAALLLTAPIRIQGPPASA